MTTRLLEIQHSLSKGKKFRIILHLKATALSEDEQVHDSYFFRCSNTSLMNFVIGSMIHPLGAVDKGVAIIVDFRPAIAARHFIFGNVDAHRVRTIVALR